MKPGGYVIIVSRGGIVDEPARRYVRSGHVAGAGIDVFEAETTSRNEPILGSFELGDDSASGGFFHPEGATLRGNFAREYPSTSAR